MAKARYKLRHIRKNGQIIASKYFPLDAKESEIEEWKVEVKAKSLIGISSKKSIRVKEFVPRFFQMKKLHTDNQYSTIYKQHCDIENHILPYFGNVPLNEITTRALIDWQSDIVKDEENNPDGLAPNSMKNVHSTFNQFFTYAIIDGHVVNNPVTSLPRIKVKPSEFNFWTGKQSSAFLKKCRTMDWDVFQVVVLALHCGARPGELRALLRKDLDFHQGCVHIRRTYCIKKNEIKNRTKNGQDRTIHVPRMVLHSLQDKIGLDGNEQIFPFMTNAWGWHYFKPIQEKMDLDLPYLRTHDLRHSFASQLAMAGKSVLEIRDLLGHKKLSSTEVYMHLAKGYLKGATDVLAEDADWFETDSQSNVVLLNR